MPGRFLTQRVILLPPRLEVAGLPPFSYPTGYEYQNLNFADWSLDSGNVTLTQNAVSSPDGGIHGAVLTELATTAYHYILINPTLTSGAKTLTVFMKRGSGSRNGWLFVHDGGFSSNASVLVNLGTGGIISAAASGSEFSGVSASSSAYGAWWKIVLLFTHVNSGAVYYAVQPHEGSGGSYLGDGSTLHLWGLDVR